MKAKRKLRKMLSLKSMRNDLTSMKKNMKKGMGSSKIRGF